jgi:hypothetical protein
MANKLNHLTKAEQRSHAQLQTFIRFLKGLLKPSTPPHHFDRSLTPVYINTPGTFNEFRISPLLIDPKKMLEASRKLCSAGIMTAVFSAYLCSNLLSSDYPGTVSIAIKTTFHPAGLSAFKPLSDSPLECDQLVINSSTEMSATLGDWIQALERDDAILGIRSKTGKSWNDATEEWEAKKKEEQS